MTFSANLLYFILLNTYNFWNANNISLLIIYKFLILQQFFKFSSGHGHMLTNFLTNWWTCTEVKECVASQWSRTKTETNNFAWILCSITIDTFDETDHFLKFIVTSSLKVSKVWKTVSSNSKNRRERDLCFGQTSLLLIKAPINIF